MNVDLETGAQRQAAEWVRTLPEETPSLAWRSALNERIREEAAKRSRRRRTFLFATPGLGLATAAGLAFVLLFPSRAVAPDPKPESRVEANLVALYEESARTDDIVGSGLRPWEAPSAPSIDDTDPLWDLEVL